MTGAEGTAVCMILLGVLIAIWGLVVRIEKLEEWRRQKDRQ